jgi:hypothetical protein
MNHLKTAGITVLTMLIVFAILDYLNLSGWLLFPVSCSTGYNAKLTTSVGNTPAPIGTTGNGTSGS